MNNEVVRLMRRTKNRRIQYDCIKALCAMWAKRGPGYRTFIANPDQYMNEFASFAVSSDVDIRPPEEIGKAPAQQEVKASTKQARPVPGRSAWALAAGGICFLLAGAVLFSGAFLFYFGWKKRARTAG